MNINDLRSTSHTLLKPVTRLPDSKAKLYAYVVSSGGAYKSIKASAMSTLFTQALKDKIAGLPPDDWVAQNKEVLSFLGLQDRQTKDAAMRRPDDSPKDWTYMPLEKIPGKSPEAIFLYFGEVTIDGKLYKLPGSHPCSKDCKGIYLWPDQYKGARVLVIYT